jgi:uncharacterized protein with GYD domain
VAHFMISMKYSADAVKAMVANPQDRKKAATAAIEAAGGKMVGAWFTFGARDVIVIYEAPDAISAIGLSMVLGASGAAADVETTPLLTTAEAMAAMKHAAKALPSYKSPMK